MNWSSIVIIMTANSLRILCMRQEMISELTVFDNLNTKTADQITNTKLVSI